MNKLIWWMRIVGVFYLLLTAMNIWALFLGGIQLLADTLPAPMNTDPLAVRAFADAWLVFVFEFGVLGAMLLYATRYPAQSRLLVLAVIGAEIFRGVVADIVWIMRGYDAASYIPFIIIHLIIIVTGLVFLRQAEAQAPRLAVA
ncbi:MAG: BphX family protein [Anaerolineales bacterium]|nr:BphX family protein [Anaerolineales bacterium]